MKDNFPFLGIPKPKRAELQNGFIKQAKKQKPIDWNSIFELWELPEREFQYLAVDYLVALKGSLQKVDIDNIKILITNKSWWDTVDNLASNITGAICAKHPELIGSHILKWSESDNIWLVRTAILFQLKYKVKITEDFIKELHSIIEVRHTGRRAGKTPYRDGQNAVRDSVSGRIVYLPPEAKDVHGLMKSLTDWIESKENRDIPAPIKAAISAYQLVTIHQFWDGNGRTARALATYILKRYDYDLKGFYSMEEFYDKDLQRYYDSLQMNLSHNYYFGRNNADLTPWITYFLDIMVEVFEKVSKKVSDLYKEDKPRDNTFQAIDKRQKWIASYIIQNGSIRSKNVSAHFGIDDTTAREWLKNWVKEGFLERKDLTQQRNIEYVLKGKYRDYVINRDLTGILLLIVQDFTIKFLETPTKICCQNVAIRIKFTVT